MERCFTREWWMTYRSITRVLMDVLPVANAVMRERRLADDRKKKARTLQALHPKIWVSYG